MALVLLLTVLIVKGWRRRLLITWTLAFICLFFNPLTARFLIGTLIPGDVYWRLIYLLPLPIAAAICVCEIIGKFEAKYKLAGFIAIFVILSLSTTYYLLDCSRQHQLQFATFKLPLEDVRDAQAIIAIAPAGVMLAPDNLYGVIPMLESAYPQIRSRVETKGFWISVKEGTLRENASDFLGGNLSDRDAFIYTITYRDFIKVVVCKAKVLNSSMGGEIKTVLQKNGFTHSKAAKSYVVFWKDEK
jgi:hypothetical protein